MNILVVDDNSVSRKDIRTELETGRYDVVEANSGAEAVEKLRDTANIDLVTLDVEMPELDGFQALTLIRDPEIAPALKNMHNENVPVVFVTSLDSEANRLRGFELGATDFVTKPFTKGELLSVVDHVLRPRTELRGLSVLVVNGSRSSRNIVTSCLKRRGVTVYEADDGLAGYNIIREKPDEIDLVITDLKMPSMNGDELCRRIRNMLGLKDLPIMFLSAGDEIGSVIDLFRIGASDHLKKPFIQEELEARLVAHLERQRLTRVLKQNVAELQTLNKLKDDFLRVCSHDLRTPLTSIMLWSDMLMQMDGLQDEHRQMVAEIKTAGDNILEMTDDILELGRAEMQREGMELSRQSLDGVVESCINSFRHTAMTKGVRLAMTHETAELTVMGNTSALARVFNNLLSNALKFTPVDGNVTVQLKMVTEEEVSVSIIDTGIGIPEDKMTELFSRYSVASRPGTNGEKGTGLGLSITKELVEAHGGTIEVVSAPNKGSTFKVKLPTID